MNDMPPLGYCPQCREMRIAVSGVPTCLNCVKPPRPKHLVKPPNATADPSDKEFRSVVGATVKVAKPIGRTVQEALDIMESLPMPKDIKDFKKIQKVIKQLKDLIGDTNVN